jgi:hypothetical protein
MTRLRHSRDVFPATGALAACGGREVGTAWHNRQDLLALNAPRALVARSEMKGYFSQKVDGKDCTTPVALEIEAR